MKNLSATITIALILCSCSQQESQVSEDTSRESSLKVESIVGKTWRGVFATCNKVLSLDKWAQQKHAEHSKKACNANINLVDKKHLEFTLHPSLDGEFLIKFTMRVFETSKEGNFRISSFGDGTKHLVSLNNTGKKLKIARKATNDENETIENITFRLIESR